MLSISSSLMHSMRLKKTPLTLLSISPALSNANIVFSKVGAAVLLQMLSISALCWRMPSLKAGM